jgi:hypothetical protein
MTAEEFIAHFKKKNKSDDMLNYLTCTFVILGALAMLCNSIGDGDYGSNALRLPLLLFAMSLYGYWRIGKQYAIREIKSPLPVTRKIEILESLLHTHKWKSLSKDGEIYTAFYSGTFLTDIHVYSFFDENKILLYATTPRIGGGFIDFGSSYRALKKVHKYFLEHL